MENVTFMTMLFFLWQCYFYDTHRNRFLAWSRISFKCVCSGLCLYTNVYTSMYVCSCACVCVCVCYLCLEAYLSMFVCCSCVGKFVVFVYMRMWVCVCQWKRRNRKINTQPLQQPYLQWCFSYKAVSMIKADINVRKKRKNSATHKARKRQAAKAQGA